MQDIAETFLVVVDDTPECAKALRYAALRAKRTGGRVKILHVLPPAHFLEWRSAQQEIEAEEQRHGEAILQARAEQVEELTGSRPDTRLLRGLPKQVVLELLTEDRSVRALVLAAAERGRPGPRVEVFAGQRAGKLPCLVIVVPGGIADADLDRLTLADFHPRLDRTTTACHLPHGTCRCQTQARPPAIPPRRW